MESRKNQNKFYVYGLINPIDDKLFYIGKGTGYRYKAHLHTQSLENSSLKNNKIKSIINSGKEPIYKIFAKDLYENEAFLLETILIKNYGRIYNGTGFLTNITGGGEGMSGFSYDRTPEFRKYISETYITKGISKGESNPMYGKKNIGFSKAMKKFHLSKPYMESDNPNAIIIHIYDSQDNLMYICNGNFQKVCLDNNLPKNALMESYLYNNSEPIYLKKHFKKYIKYKGWYAKKL